MRLTIGFFAGTATAWLISLTMLPLLGYHIGFALRADLVCGCLVLALAIVLIAAWIPARWATKLNLLETLKYESAWPREQHNSQRHPFVTPRS